MSITLIRKAKGLSLMEVASRMGIHYSYYSHLENGRRKFNPALIEKLAAALDTDISVIQKEVSDQQKNFVLLPGWMTSLKINGVSVIKAFEHQLSLQPFGNEYELKTEFADFIQRHIALSILAEFDANPELERMIRVKLAKVLRR